MTKLRALARRAGRRGAFLAFLMVLDLAYGYSLLVTPAKQRTLDLLLPWEAWGVIWIAVGMLCATGIFVFGWDRLAFPAAAVLKVVWAGLFAEVWITQKYPLGWVSVVVWLAFAGAVLIIAGWPEELKLAEDVREELKVPADLDFLGKLERPEDGPA